MEAQNLSEEERLKKLKCYAISTTIRYEHAYNIPVARIPPNLCLRLSIEHKGVATAASSDWEQASCCRQFLKGTKWNIDKRSSMVFKCVFKCVFMSVCECLYITLLHCTLNRTTRHYATLPYSTMSLHYTTLVVHWHCTGTALVLH